MGYQKNKGKKCKTRGCKTGAYTKGLCKTCYNRQYLRRYWKTNPEKQREYKARYRGTDKGRSTEEQWRKTNRERLAKLQRDRTYFKQFGLTPDDVQKIRRAQRHRCALCRKKPKQLYLDHCHKSGRPRGLLCPRCNSLLGYFEKAPKMIQRAQEYLALYQ